MLGNMLRDRESQYIATKDEGTRTWRILDTWHDVLRTMEPDDDVPEEIFDLCSVLLSSSAV